MNCSAWNGINSKHEPDQWQEAGVWGAREGNLGSSEFLGQCPPQESICVKEFVAGRMYPGESLSPGECVHGRLSLENVSQGECFPGNPHPFRGCFPPGPWHRSPRIFSTWGQSHPPLTLMHWMA